MWFPQALQMILVTTNILQVLIQSIPTSGHQYTGTPRRSVQSLTHSQGTISVANWLISGWKNNCFQLVPENNRQAVSHCGLPNSPTCWEPNQSAFLPLKCSSTINSHLNRSHGVAHEVFIMGAKGDGEGSNIHQWWGPDWVRIQVRLVMTLT